MKKELKLNNKGLRLVLVQLLTSKKYTIDGKCFRYVIFEPVGKAVRSKLIPS